AEEALRGAGRSRFGGDAAETQPRLDVFGARGIDALNRAQRSGQIAGLALRDRQIVATERDLDVPVEAALQVRDGVGGAPALEQRLAERVLDPRVRGIARVRLLEQRQRALRLIAHQQLRTDAVV